MKHLKTICFLFAFSLFLSGCGEKKEEASVYYLNFKPEAAKTWEAIAEAYTGETGIEVKVMTAASGNYEQTLKAEFAQGKVAMVQNGNWAWGQVSSTEGNIVKEEDIRFLPIYTGMSGEENQGLCTGTENFICVNSMASKKDQQASIDFIEWVYSSDVGKDYVTNSLGFISPFNTFTDEESPSDPLAKEVLAYMGNENLTSVSWNFIAFPNQQFKDDFGTTLLEYTKGEIDWDTITERVRDTWAEQKAAQ